MNTDISVNIRQRDRQPEAVGKNLLLTAALLVVAVLVSEFMLRFEAPHDTLILVYLTSVVIISRITPNFFYGVGAAVISTLLYDFLISEPRMGFSFTLRFPITLFTMLATTLIVSTTTMTMKKHALLATEQEKHMNLLYERSRELLGARSYEKIIEIATTHIYNDINMPMAFYRADPLTTEIAPLIDEQSESRRELLLSDRVQTTVHRHFVSAETGPTTLRLPNEENIVCIPLSTFSRTIGVVCLLRGEHPLTEEQLTHIQTVLGQVTPVLELQNMIDRQTRQQVTHERDQERNMLLRSISHDLRTPLTSISGASSTLLEQKNLDSVTHDTLLRDIHETSAWLTRMVENILAVTRISKDTLKVKKSAEPLEEVLSHSASIVRKRYPECQIYIDIPDELVLVPMDSTLISQVTINLLDNAAKNSQIGGLVLLSLRRDDHNATVEVSDNGCGIPHHLLNTLFDRFTSEYIADGSRGIGIGLSICHTIILAHDGTIEGRNRADGGAIFTYSLPLQEVQ